ESIYDHPFQWGSERTGPDLARVGGKYSNDWHVAHLTDPRDVVPESVMPPYAFLADHPLDLDQLASHMRTNRIVGVPYTDEMIANAKADAIAQVDPNADTTGLLKRYPGAVTGGLGGDPNQITERDALIAYLQILGTMVKFRDVSPDDLRQ
ncbi:MAG TPA: cbb3-type cytochrome c oxidase subunit II, partial [Stellaceae bacterium]|nr:cbb3-type cytochrome c oxidase subunit II [Stellaceae bacterium]